jgi:hypothetical protein
MANIAVDEPPTPLRPRLARLRDALSHRDWLGIAIELAVVTVGVLLAFQVDQWGSRRQQAGLEREYLERFYRENAQGADELRTIVAQYDKLILEVGTALRSQNDPDRLRPLLKQRDFGCRMGALPSAAYNDTASAELVSSGRLSLISDPGLQSDLRRLAASQVRGAAELVTTSSRVSDSQPALDPYYRLNIDARNGPVCSINWLKLLRDQKAVNAATRLLRRHVQTRQARLDTLRLNLELQQRLACFLGKSECRSS